MQSLQTNDKRQVESHNLFYGRREKGDLSINKDSFADKIFLMLLVQ